MKLRSLVFALVWILTLSAFASEKSQIQSMNAVSAKIEELKKQYTASEILVVFDIDNTLLTTESDLGGDAWFIWQEEKLKNKDPQDRVAIDFDGLLRVQGYLYSLNHMNPAEAMTPNFMRRLQDQGHAVFMLTSRGSEFLNFTQRELSRNGYEASLTAPGPRGGYAGKFLPYDLQNPEKSCLKAEELAAWGLKESKPSVYSEGVFYTSGQHKGAMLRALLCKVRKSYKAIVFVDDTEKHVDRILLAYQRYNVNVQSMRYGAMDAQVERFKKSDKKQVIEAWAVLKAAFEQAFGRPF